jgi:hypothetical protein
MSPKEVTEYIKVCKKHGVTELEVGNLKLKLIPDYTPPEKLIAEQSTKPEPTLTDEDLLLWSSGGIPVNLDG